MGGLQVYPEHIKTAENQYLVFVLKVSLPLGTSFAMSFLRSGLFGRKFSLKKESQHAI